MENTLPLLFPDGSSISVVRFEYNGRPVLTTKQLVNIFNCGNATVRSSYSKHKDEYVKDVDFFKLERQVLCDYRAFVYRSVSSDGNVSRVSSDGNVGNLLDTIIDLLKGPSLFLWTESGVLKLSRRINTEGTKIAFAILSAGYFKLLPETLFQPAKSTIRAPESLTDEWCGYVYVFELNNGNVKIGVSSNVHKRIKHVEWESKSSVTKIYHTELLPRKKAFEIERAVHNHFAAQCVNKEIFSVSFDQACEQIKQKIIDVKFEVQEKPPQIQDEFSKREKLELLNRYIEFTQDQSLKERLIREAAKLILGKEF